MASRLNVYAEKPMTIKPARPTKNQTIFLSNLDQQLFFHVEMLFMYDVQSPDTGDVVDNVRNALAEALVPYYFAAGRFRVNEQEKRLEVECNGAGADFAGAYCDSTIAELGDLRIPNPDFRKLLVYPVDVKRIEDIPLFSIQVTRFKCGGFIVGIYTSHIVFDGISGCQFFSDIGRISRGESIAAKATMTPDRTTLRSRSPPRISYAHPELMSLPDIPARLLFNPASYDVSKPPVHAFKTFSFSLAQLDLLKKRAIEGGEVSRCSTFEALTGHVWKARTTALGMDPSSRAKLFVAMNIRDKLKSPALPDGFTGNAVVAAPCVDTTVDSVVNGSLSLCVRKVRDAIASVNEEYIRSEIDWCEVNGHGIIDLPGGMIITPWSKLPFDGVDFGWGAPTYIAAPVNDRPEYVLVLSSCKGDGGVDVFMAMEFHKMRKLEECLSI
ncbi:BAHD family acyltransferase, clade V [Selaginella moellendorffii]|uniref:BAHD family acyltransferase, clade V n=2 Tax=Selaginella moellendorffii TaxID=88036 RepID=D8RIP8_SELML|nr:omega-hydroxypalmitate O-feruloyl transferase isoform X3 [Selaginella moellendorffii]EFJ27564.1 BAHD family acyltransferase, clade V [Selaginella moellendorffii]|eukprot:XP_002970966.1 omega-hydroxypalmitate O-feruloyl transferase isoform X3 [Selaginella moellendorffii]